MKIKKYWSVMNDFVNYKEAYKEICQYPENTFITRKEWNGVHYINRFGEYCILLKTGEIIVNPIDVFKIDQPDWLIVEVTDEAKIIIERHSKGE